MAVTSPDSQAPKPDHKAPLETRHTVLTALAFRNAADQLVQFALAARSLGLASWGFGVVFGGLAVGLRFWKATDMEEPEFVSCIVFASVLVLGGFCLYVLESRGFVKLVSEFAAKKPDASDAPAGTTPSTVTGPGADELEAARLQLLQNISPEDMTEPGAAPVVGPNSP